jgi:hypothetical protein
MKSRTHFRMQSPRFPGEDKEQWAERNREFMYEEAIVKYLIRQLQLPTVLRSKLWAKHKSDSSDDFGRLTLSVFCLETRFPVWLGSRQLKDQRQLPLSKLLRDFHSTHMCRALMDTSRSLSDSFKWSGLATLPRSSMQHTNNAANGCPVEYLINFRAIPIEIGQLGRRRVRSRDIRQDMDFVSLVAILSVGLIQTLAKLRGQFPPRVFINLIRRSKYNRSGPAMDIMSTFRLERSAGMHYFDPKIKIHPAGSLARRNLTRSSSS